MEADSELTPRRKNTARRWKGSVGLQLYQQPERTTMDAGGVQGEVVLLDAAVRPDSAAAFFSLLKNRCGKG